jgi:predicted deacylase
LSYSRLPFQFHREAAKGAKKHHFSRESNVTIRLGNAKAVPGRVKYGTYHLLDHPVGGREEMPVIMAQGDPSGPVFWITAGIHGPEHAGIQVVHQLITRELAKALHGTLIAIPALNPAGVRTNQRQAYYLDDDPNRQFPDGKPVRERDPEDEPPSALEQAYGRLFDEIKANASYMADLHNYSINSVSFVFRDRVFYRNDGKAEQNKKAKAAAEKLNDQLSAMCAAYGHSVIGEMPVKKYVAARLHRSTTAAAVNLAHIPALTMELSTGPMPDPAVVRAAVTGLRNILRWAGMLPGALEAITGIQVVDPGYPCRRHSAPRVTQPCVVEHLCQPGDLIRQGQPLAEVRDIYGRPTGEKVLNSEFDGWVIGRHSGVVHYPGASLYSLAIRDELPNVVAYPKDYWK